MAYKAAFSSEDVEDAKRGQPAISLSGYAAERGLQHIDHNTPAGYRTALPCDPQFQFNVMRGRLPGGEHGILAHEALALPWIDGEIAWSGWFQTIGKPKRSGPRLRDFTVGLIPFAEWFTGWGGGQEDVEPARAPCTVAAVRVPESAGAQPHLRIDNRDAAPPAGTGSRSRARSPTTAPSPQSPCPGSPRWSCAGRCRCWGWRGVSSYTPSRGRRGPPSWCWRLRV